MKVSLLIQQCAERSEVEVPHTGLVASGRVGVLHGLGFGLGFGLGLGLADPYPSATLTLTLTRGPNPNQGSGLHVRRVGQEPTEGPVQVGALVGLGIGLGLGLEQGWGWGEGEG